MISIICWSVRDACTFGSVKSGVLNAAIPLPSGPWHIVQLLLKMLAPSGGSLRAASATGAEGALLACATAKGSASRTVRAAKSTRYLFPSRSNTTVVVESFTNSTPKYVAKGLGCGLGRPGMAATEFPSMAST